MCVLMSGWLIALLALIPLLAFGMWLTFNAILVKWHGLDALKETPAIYKVFVPHEWFRLSPRSDSHRVRSRLTRHSRHLTRRGLGDRVN